MLNFTTSIFSEEHPIGQVILKTVFFSLVTLISWFGLLGAFFLDTTALWPAFACAAPAIGFSIYLHRIKVAHRLLNIRQLTTVVTILSVCFLLMWAIIIATLRAEADNSLWHYSLVPSLNLYDVSFGPIHWILLFSSMYGVVAGRISIAARYELGLSPILIVVAACLVIHTVYLIVWIISFFATWIALWNAPIL